MNEKDLLRQLIKENLKRKLLYEGLIWSYPSSYVFKKLQEMGFLNVSFTKEKTFLVKFQLDQNNAERYKKLNDFMEACGWKHGATMANSQITKNKNHFLKITEGASTLQYEAKFDIQVDKIPEKLFHLTFYSKLKKIFSKGLTPKTSYTYFNFEDRIYLSKDVNALIDFSFKKYNTTETNNFVVLEIYTPDLDKNMRFFEDPNFKNGLYTLENIPPYSIRPIIEIDIDENGMVKQNKL